MAINDGDDVNRLLAEGRYADAARVARAAGDLARATEIYERVWDFESAAVSAREADDLPRALRNAIEARAEDLVQELIATLDETEEGRRAALDVLSDRQRPAEAAVLAEKLEETERAIELYRSAHRELDAARLLVASGRDRDAGRILERLVATTGDPLERARGHLELGRILAVRLQHGDSVRHLQQATAHPSTAAQGRRLLVVELAALGLHSGARGVLLEARRDDPSLPANLDAALEVLRQPVVPTQRSDRSQVIAGRYRLEKMIGSGSSGRVFRAVDEVGDREVAVKLFSGRERGDASYERFAREARIASQLRHPNLVEVLDFSAEQGYLVMEYLEGGSLERLLATGLSGPRVRRMALDVLAGLEVAHQRGVIHRDIKPANIFLSARGSAKLGDFGVAHLLDLGQTQTGGLIGTLAYMSPEQITGAPLTIAADFYALGITVFEALSGRLPFQGPDFVAQHLGEAPPLISEVADVPEAWDEPLLRLLAKSPDDRFASVGELRSLLASLELGGSAHPLIMPRSDPVAGRVSSSVNIPAQAAQVDDPDQPRYQFETPIGSSSVASLSRALDVTLNRSVIIERYTEPLTEERERRLYALARGGGPFVQRALAYDAATAVCVYEAPSGRPIGELEEPIKTRLAARLLKRLARAVAPLHDVDRAHGAITPSTVMLDDHGHPTLLVSGLDPEGQETGPEADVSAILDVLASAIGAQTGAASVIAALVPAASEEERRRLLEMPRSSGDDLYAFADSLELTLLTHKGVEL